MRDDHKISRPRAKAMRQALTNAETMLWSRLRRGQIRGLKFRRQHPIGPFIVDFACWEARLVIEVDGATHSSESERKKDANRTAFLDQAGWDVLRVWNNEVYSNLNGVIEAIETRAFENQMAIQSNLNTPSDATRHLPRWTGEEKESIQ